MKSNIRRSIRGPFLVHDLGRGAWRLAGTVPPNIDILVQGAAADDSQVLSLENCAELCVEWQEAGVNLTWPSAAGDSSLKMRSAIIHEPQARLYEGLPLASYDAAARGFWRRIFRIMRIPGGRYLLGFLARRHRSGA
jgi:hypothetical protein